MSLYIPRLKLILNAAPIGAEPLTWIGCGAPTRLVLTRVPSAAANVSLCLWRPGEVAMENPRELSQHLFRDTHSLTHSPLLTAAGRQVRVTRVSWSQHASSHRQGRQYATHGKMLPGGLPSSEAH
jgi:hypothetical protein